MKQVLWPGNYLFKPKEMKSLHSRQTREVLRGSNQRLGQSALAGVGATETPDLFRSLRHKGLASFMGKPLSHMAPDQDMGGRCQGEGAPWSASGWPQRGLRGTFGSSYYKGRNAAGEIEQAMLPSLRLHRSRPPWGARSPPGRRRGRTLTELRINPTFMMFNMTCLSIWVSWNWQFSRSSRNRGSWTTLSCTKINCLLRIWIVITNYKSETQPKHH